MSALSLRSRVVAAIALTTIVTSLLFGLITFSFAYSLEDSLFENALAREVARQQRAAQLGQPLPAPLLPYVRIHVAAAALPVDLAPQLAAEPQRREFFGGAGRHYHVARFTLPGPGGGPAIAVAETSRYLLVRPERNRLLLFLASLCGGVALLGAVLGWWLAGRALSPLGRLAGEIAGAGDGGIPRIDPRSYPANELGVLAATLAGAFDRIRGFIAREQAFTRDASHELRTPLAVIAGAAEVMALDPALPATAQPALRRIETASADMAAALDLLLALAREQHAGRATAGSGALLRPLVEKAVADAAARFPASPAGISIEIPEHAAVPVDPVLLQLVLGNLIGNAFQHAAPGELLIRGDGAGLLVADGGPGLAGPADPFAPFARHAGSAGSGLGLAITRRLCDAAGIGLSWRSADRRPGTEFTLDFSRIGAPAA